MMLSRTFKLLLPMALAAGCAFADGPKFKDFKVKLTGVAVVPDGASDDTGANVLPPQTRVVVTPGNKALFYLEYSFPTNVTSLMFLLANFDDDVLDSLSPFAIYASGIVSGVGKSKMGLGMVDSLINKPYEEDMLLKSVRIKCMLLPEKGAPHNKVFVICDAPVNVLFSNKADSDGKGAVVLPPMPTPQPDPTLGMASLAKEEKPKSSTPSTPAGFTDNLDEALAKAKQEGKLVYVCFTGSDWCAWCVKLDRKVFAKPEFAPAVEKDYVLVYIDSPKDKGRLTDRAKTENPKLIKKYGIHGFPTALILDGDGNKVGVTGYRKGGAQAYAEHLLDIKKKR